MHGRDKYLPLIAPLAFEINRVVADPLAEGEVFHRQNVVKLPFHVHHGDTVGTRARYIRNAAGVVQQELLDPKSQSEPPNP